MDKALPLLYGFGYVFIVIPALPPDEFGLLGIVEVIFYFILAIDNGLVQTPMAKFVAENNFGSWAIAHGFVLSGSILLLFSIGCMAGGSVLVDLFKAPNLHSVLWSLPALLAGFYLKNLTAQICIARQWTGRLFLIDAIYFLGSLAILISLRIAGTLATAAQVILANVFTALAASFAGLFATWEVLQKSRWRIQFAEIVRFLTFGKYSFGAGLGAYLNAQLDVIFVAHFYGPVSVGIYRAGKIIYRLYNAFSQATQVVILPLASKLEAAQQRDGLRVLFEKSIFFSYLIVVPLNFALLLGAAGIFSQLYSGRYDESVPVFRWLLVGAFLLPWGAIGINLLLGAGKPNLTFGITWIVVAVYSLCSLVLVQSHGLQGAAVANVIGTMAGALLTTVFVKNLTGFTWRGIMRRFADVSNFARRLWQSKKSNK
ncbi:MAG: oligosaccharide flippase family protein [bacterium]